MAYDLVTRGRKDFRVRVDSLHREVRDPLEGVVGSSNVVFRTRYKPVSSDPVPVVYTSGSMNPDDYDFDCESGTVVFESAPSIQPTATYHWSNLTDVRMVEILAAGFHEMESRWPRRFKLVDAGGSEVLYPGEESVVYIVDQDGVDPTCGSDTFSTSTVELNLLLECARYAYLSERIADEANKAIMFREDRGLTVDRRVVPANIDLALKSADGSVKRALRAAQAKFYTSGEHLGSAMLQPGTKEYFTDHEWQTDSRDDDYRETYAGST